MSVAEETALPDGTVEKLVAAPFRMTAQPAALVANPGGPDAACPSQPKLPRVGRARASVFTQVRGRTAPPAPLVCPTIHDQLENHRWSDCVH